MKSLVKLQINAFKIVYLSGWSKDNKTRQRDNLEDLQINALKIVYLSGWNNDNKTRQRVL